MSEKNNAKNIHISCFDNYPAFNDIIKSVKYACEAAEFNVSFGNFSLKKDAINIVFAGHKLHIDQIKNNGIKDIIIYNLEQVKPSTPWFNQNYLELLSTYKVWDYNQSNINKLKNAGVSNIDYLPIGYTKNIELIQQKIEQEKDIDVFFYGLMNERRQNILNSIAGAGLNVVATLHGEFLDDNTRNKYISRSKIILNLSYYDDAEIFEMARVSFLMANKSFVLSEQRDGIIIDEAVKNSIAFASLENIAQTCIDYINNLDARNDIINKSYATITKQDISQNVLTLINKYINEKYIIDNNQQEPPKKITNCENIPKKLQIGSGKSWKYDFINIDIDSRWKPDLLFNLNNPFPFNQDITTWRFGNINIPKRHFEYILSEHVFEHLSDVVQAMTTCIELLADGGVLEIEVPYDLSHGAWQDPTHVRAFNENSWLYYTDWYWYIGWKDYRFDNVGYNFGLSGYGNELMQKYNNDFDAVRRIPRAIDVFRINLQKRAVTEQEKAKNQYLYPGWALESSYAGSDLMIID